MSDDANLNELALANVEALAENEGSDCHYTNGWTAFSGKSGGGYDCCQIWVSKAPDQGAGHCR